MATATIPAQPQRLSLLRVLGPGHVWALGVGIVLVGEFMGWNFSVGKGGALGSLIACWVCGLLYTCVAMIDSEVTSTISSVWSGSRAPPPFARAFGATARSGTYQFAEPGRSRLPEPVTQPSSRTRGLI